jgi:hypothetical protein
MANIMITHTCGHQESHQLYGSSSERSRKETWLETTLCYACYRADIEARRQAESAQSATANREIEMPPLAGTDRQIAWAETLRANCIENLVRTAQTDARRYLTAAPDHEARAHRLKDEGFKTTVEQRTALAEALVDLVYPWCASQTSAHWWIDHRDSLESVACRALAERAWAALLAIQEGNDALAAAEAARLEAERQERERQAQAQRLREIQRAAEAEATVVPEGAVTGIVSVITVLEKSVQVRQDSAHERAREVLRDLDYTYDAGHWSRPSTSPQERAVEVAHRLLCAKIPIRLSDPDLRRRAIAGQYEALNYRSVVLIKTGAKAGWFGIHWSRRHGEDYYRQSSRIHGARWRSPYMAAPPGSFEEVEDFARIHGFKIYPLAQALIDEQRALIDNAIAVAPLPEPEAAPVVPAGTVPPRLPVPETVEVDPALLDDLETAPC